MIRDDAVTQWDEHFSSIMFNVLQAVDKEGFSKNTKQSALKALKCLMYAGSETADLRPSLCSASASTTA